MIPKNKKEAEAHSALMLAKLDDKDWKPDVFNNLGWCVAANHKPTGMRMHASFHGDTITYTCYMGGEHSGHPSHLCVDADGNDALKSFKCPRKAAKNCIEVSKRIAEATLAEVNGRWTYVKDY